MSQQFHRRRGSAFGADGFTLIELLVAGALAVLVAGLAVEVLQGPMKGFRDWADRESARARGRQVLNRIETDLQNVVTGRLGEPWLAARFLDQPDNSGLWEDADRAKPTGVEGVNSDHPIVGARFGQAGVWLRLFIDATGAHDSEGIDGLALPRAVGYQLVRRTDPDRSERGPRHYLHRSEVRPDALAGRPGTREAGWDLESAPESQYWNPGPENDDSVAGDPIELRTPAASETILAGGVADFGVRLFRRSASGWVCLFPDSPDDEAYICDRTSESLLTRPAQAVELMVRVLTSSGEREVARLESAAADSETPTEGADDRWWRVVEENSEVVTRWVSLPGAGR